MSTYLSLHLREPNDRKEKSFTQHQKNRQRQKTYLKELLTANILKGIGNKTMKQRALAGSIYV